jgi:hypothetical protein
MRARSPREVTLFVGPTAAALTAKRLLRGVRRRPPVQRRDVSRLVARARAPGVLVIVDGVFHDTLSVGHAEIREALDRGWEVWGLASMGAIRAREMAPLGMKGFGEVFARFCEEGDFQDDEVALLHEPAPPWRAASEPLVHLRAAVDHLIARGIVRAADGREVVLELKSRWYGDRTVKDVVRALSPRAIGRLAAVERELSDFDRFRIKTKDLERFLLERPWERKGA